MKRHLINKLFEIASLYYGFDFFHILEATETFFYHLKITFKNKKNENNNQ